MTSATSHPGGQPTAGSARFHWLALVLVLALATCLRWPSLDLPLDRDEGGYATLAQQWSRGGLPYRDFLDQKPPLVPALYRAAIGIAGETAAAVRGMAMLSQLATVVGLFLLMRRLAGDTAGTAAAAVYALASCGSRIQGLAANTESFVTLPVIGALLLVMASQARPGTPARAPADAELPAATWLGAGALVGVASLAKQPAVLVAVLLPLVVARGITGRAQAILWCGLGGILPWLLALGVFAANGAAGDAVYCVLTYNLSYAGQGAHGWADRLVGAARGLAPEQGMLWLLATLGILRPSRDGAHAVLPLVAWLVASALGVLASGRFYPHYFIVLVAPLACLGGLWLAGFEHGRPRQLVAPLAALALLVTGWAVTSGPVYQARSGAERSVRLYGIPHFALAPEVASLVQKADPGGDSLWIWGAEAELYFLTGRRPASRFIYHYPFTGDAPSYPGGASELVAGLTAPGTRVAVVADRLDESREVDRTLASLLRRDFVPVTQRGPFLVMRRR